LLHCCTAELQDDLKLGKRLGSGGFGSVYKATLTNEDGSTTPVIVKKACKAAATAAAAAAWKQHQQHQGLQQWRCTAVLAREQKRTAAGSRPIGCSSSMLYLRLHCLSGIIGSCSLPVPATLCYVTCKHTLLPPLLLLLLPPPPLPPPLLLLLLLQAKEFGEAEVWMNERMTRASPSSCAEFLGGFLDTEDSKKVGPAGAGMAFLLVVVLLYTF
jgi:hypothetical protein